MNTIIIDKDKTEVTYKASKLYTAGQSIPIKLVDMLVITDSVCIDTKSIIQIANVKRSAELVSL
ncbi:hypothetical protein FA592_02965 [Sulfurospirillum diekertiae]|uniref:Uncharacterized protein n=1 Tax=Sulfurospirillum diekertiae TaxID=1854492 RepID=A0A6G9VS94_9BACT|nr:hypothetical protein [Sulfurospirillum diekertiae]QIR75243.1 hypothetical protein FA584_03065 [Sulfurospirillum diekertiae]QIR77894.1 hypothetical protein FA592_02965 [Sulfurospirillum diekertiae]